MTLDRTKLVVALQGLLLSLAACIATFDSHLRDFEAAAAGIDEPHLPDDWSPELPADLRRERLPVARVPEIPDPRNPAVGLFEGPDVEPIPEVSSRDHAPKLASLRSTTHDERPRVTSRRHNS